MPDGASTPRTATLDEQTADTEPPGRTRAPAMPPAERRALIVDATLPLLLEHGPAVTTRQIAEAAGVAEGTIFRAFPDKETLVDAVLDHALDPAPVEAALRAIDPSLPLEPRLVAAVEILRRRTATVWQLVSTVGTTRRTSDGRPVPRRSPPDLNVLASLFEPDRDRIRRDPKEAAQLLRGLTLAGTHPALVLEEPLPSEEIVSLLLDGIRTRTA